MPLPRLHRDSNNRESPNSPRSSSANPPERTSSDNRERSERSSSSSRGHSRSPHRHRHGHRRRRFRFKQKERNFLAAVCSMVVIVVLCTAMAEPNWFYVRGGGCRDTDNNVVHSLGVYQFFYLGHFETMTSHAAKDHKAETGKTTTSSKDVHKLVYHFSENPADLLEDCVTPRIVQVMRSIIALCFIGIAFSLMGFFLDLTGPSSHSVKILRRNAVFNILTVVVCVTINGFSFLVTQLLESLQNDTKLHSFSKVEIRFDVSFYLIAAAGGMSVIAAACNLLRRYPPYDHGSSEQRENLLDDYDGMEIGLPHGPTPDFYAPMAFMPPPPAYSP